MTDIKTKALALVNEVTGSLTEDIEDFTANDLLSALIRAIEQHDAFKREVSDAVETYADKDVHAPITYLGRFIIPKTDPLVEAVNEAWGWRGPHPDVTENLRAAIEARGGRIVWEVR